MKKTTLYQKDSRGKVRVWSIWIESSSRLFNSFNLICEHGQLYGKLQTNYTPINQGLGSKSVLEQAESDMQTEIHKKLKQGYVEDITQIKSKEETATIKKPMKALLYHPERKNNGITLSDAGIGENNRLGIQRKLDGFRYRIKLEYSPISERIDITFYSSSGDIVPSFYKIESSLRDSFLRLTSINREIFHEIILDGEIYCHGILFNDIQSACGTKIHMTPEKLALRDKMQFHIFDVYSDLPYEERLEMVAQFIDHVNVVEVETLIWNNCSDRDIKMLFEQFLEEGYEGLIIRRLDLPYKHSKGKHMLKYKPLIDDEFQIVGFKESIKGNTLGSLKLKNGNEDISEVFECALKDELGSEEMKKKIWDNKSEYIGKWVTVDFMEYTQDGIPRHPRAKCFRKGKSID